MECFLLGDRPPSFLQLGVNGGGSGAFGNEDGYVGGNGGSNVSNDRSVVGIPLLLVEITYLDGYINGNSRSSDNFNRFILEKSRRVAYSNLLIDAILDFLHGSSSRSSI